MIIIVSILPGKEALHPLSAGFSPQRFQDWLCTLCRCKKERNGHAGNISARVHLWI